MFALKRFIALVIAAAVLAFGSFAGCDNAPAINVEESVRVADFQQTSQSTLIRVMETVGVADFQQTSQSTLIRVMETIGVADLPQTSQSEVVRLTEIIAVTDSALILPPIVISLMESIFISDSSTFAPVQQKTPPSLTPPVQVTIEIASPKAGAVWLVGTAQNIVWTTTGEGIAYVGIYYSIDGGKSMYAITQKESNDGIHTWKVPNTPSKTVLVRILAYNANGGTLALADSGLFTVSIQ